MKWFRILCCGVCSSLLFTACSSNVVDEKPVEKPKEKEKVKEVYKVVNEEDYKFDKTPVLYDGIGYLVQVEGMYGLIDENGNYVYEPSFPGLYYLKDDVILRNSLNTPDGINMMDGSDFMGGFGLVDGGYVNVFDPDTKDVFQKSYVDMNGMADMYLDLPESEEFRTYVIYQDEDVTLDPEFYNNIPYYIYVMYSNEIYGPYNPEENAAFTVEKIRNEAMDEIVFDLETNIQIPNLFYVKTEDGYVIHSMNDAKKSKKAFEDVEWLSSDCCKVYSGKKMGIIDKDCNLVIWGEFEDIAQPCNGMTYVKKDGSWKLVELQ